jgi:uncharacterized LabA/DUF88 family protein
MTGASLRGDYPHRPAQKPGGREVLDELYYVTDPLWGFGPRALGRLYGGLSFFMSLMRTNLYIDGFNLYYGCVKGTPYRWLDLAKFCQAMLNPENRINRIRYFTAWVKPRSNDPQQLQRQQIYIRALQTIPNLTVHFGHYLTNPTRMPLANPPAKGPRTVEVIKTEEKGSDVNLATYLLLDGFKRDYEMAVIVSNDSDLLEPITVVRKEFRLGVGVINPHQNISWALKKKATFYKQIEDPDLLKACQFPHKLSDAKGTITKPPSW